jgi:hypothetical protein
MGALKTYLFTEENDKTDTAFVEFNSVWNLLLHYASLIRNFGDTDMKNILIVAQLVSR